MPGAGDNKDLTDEERLKLEKEKEQREKGIQAFQQDKEKTEGEEKKEEGEEETLPPIGLDMILRFIASFASKGLPPELKKRFIEEYIDWNEMPLTAIGWNKSIGWLLKYLEIMPDYQRFLLGCGILVGSGFFIRLEFSKIIKEQLKEKQKKEGKSSGEPKK